MFKVEITGKSVDELNSNVMAFLNRVNDSSHTNLIRQEVQLPDIAPRSEKVEVRPEPVKLPPTIVEPILGSITMGDLTNITLGTNDYGVDSRGVPWNEKIHSVTQAKMKDGSWRYKRGVEDSQIEAIEGALADKKTNKQKSMGDVPLVAIEPPIIPRIESPVAALSAHTLQTFKDKLIPTLADLVKVGKLTPDYVNSLCEHYGVDMLYKVNDQQLEEIFNAFVQYGMISKVG